MATTTKKPTSTTLTQKGRAADAGEIQYEPYNRGDLARGMLKPAKVQEETVQRARPKGTEGFTEIASAFDPTFHFQKVGDFVKGTFVEKREAVGDNEGNIYVVQVGQGPDMQRVGVWGKTTLDKKMAGVALGTFLCIELLAMKPSRFGTPYYDFRVLIRG
jgi:hypothetical protein